MFLDSPDIYDGKGVISFDPNPIKGSTKKMFKPWWVIGRIDGDIGNYYSYLLQKRHGIRLQRPAWGPHISVVRGEQTSQDNWDQFKEKYDEKSFKFTYEVSPKTNGDHWWLRVICDELKQLREDMGYSRDGKWGLHLTLGLPIPVCQK